MIEKQDELILMIQSRNLEIESENDRLTRAVVELKQISDQSFRNDLTWGLGGAMIGTALVLLIKR